MFSGLWVKYQKFSSLLSTMYVHNSQYKWIFKDSLNILNTSSKCNLWCKIGIINIFTKFPQDFRLKKLLDPRKPLLSNFYKSPKIAANLHQYQSQEVQLVAMHYIATNTCATAKVLLVVTVRSWNATIATDVSVRH